MKEKVLFVLILISFLYNGYCDDIIYVVTQNSDLIHPNELLRRVAIVQKSEIVFFRGRIDSRPHGFEFFVRTEQGQEGWINARHIIPHGSLPLPDSISGRFWIPEYYQKFVLGYQKEALFEYEPFWRDEYHKHTEGWNGWGDQDLWWQWAGNMRFIIRDSLVRISGLYVSEDISFANISQRQYGNNFILNVKCEWKSNFTPQNRFIMRFNEGEAYRLTFRMDGDYMDVFVDNDNEKLTTLVGVNEYFRKAVWDFFYDDKEIDLSQIIWPRRADGSMDYPPPIGVDLSRSYDDIILIKDFKTDFINNFENLILQSASNNIDPAFMPLWLLSVIIIGVVIAFCSFVLLAIKRKKG